MHPLLFLTPTICVNIRALDANGRISHSFRRSYQLALVLADVSHTILDRESRVQSQTPRRTPPIFTRLTPASILFIRDGLVSFHQVPLNEYFPEYSGGTDADEGARYIRDRFAVLNHHSSEKEIYAM